MSLSNTWRGYSFSRADTRGCYKPAVLAPAVSPSLATTVGCGVASKLAEIDERNEAVASIDATPTTIRAQTPAPDLLAFSLETVSGVCIVPVKAGDTEAQAKERATALLMAMGERDV